MYARAHSLSFSLSSLIRAREREREKREREREREESVHRDNFRMSRDGGQQHPRWRFPTSDPNFREQFIHPVVMTPGFRAVQELMETGEILPMFGGPPCSADFSAPMTRLNVNGLHYARGRYFIWRRNQCLPWTRSRAAAYNRDRATWFEEDTSEDEDDEPRLMRRPIRIYEGTDEEVAAYGQYPLHYEIGEVNLGGRRRRAAAFPRRGRKRWNALKGVWVQY